MTCREVIEFLAGYLDNELPDSQRGLFERHLAVCPPCVEYLRTYQAAIALGRAAFVDERGEVCGPVPEDMVAAILAARGRAGNSPAE